MKQPRPAWAPPRPAVEVVPPGPVDARLAAPTSKSVTNRLLVLAALAWGESTLADPLDSDDTAAMRRVLNGMRIRVEEAPGPLWRIHGGPLVTPPGMLDCGLSGTTMRFGVALASVSNWGARFTGHPSLLRRPTGPLVAAIEALGGKARDLGGYPPVDVQGGGLGGGAVTVDARGSSQFASALLMVAPYADTDVTLTVAGAPALAYVELTA